MHQELWGFVSVKNTPPKFNSSPLKNGGWKTFAFPILSFGNFSGGELLNFVRVPAKGNPSWPSRSKGQGQIRPYERKLGILFLPYETLVVGRGKFFF